MDSNKPTRSVVCTVDMHFLPEELDQSLQLLISTVGRTEAKPGCLECSVGRGATQAAHIRYNEAWDSESAFQRHLQSDEFRRVLVAMDMCCEEPKVVVGNLTGHSGIEYLKKLRERTNG